MKTHAHWVVFALVAASEVHAQQVVQWRVQDGGNGHWYRWYRRVPGRDWHGWNAFAQLNGAHLATCVTAAENSFVASPAVFQDAQPGALGGDARIGAFQAPEAPEPGGDWRWVSGEPFVPGNAQWAALEDANYCGEDGEDSCVLWSWAGDVEVSGLEGRWNDVGKCLDWWGAVVEWSADCNNDGIVDFGQCRDGSVPDFNCNNVPDCCEGGASCQPGTYPVQWRSEDGGNGHWYGLHLVPSGIAWTPARDRAVSAGGHLSTITSNAEGAFVFRLADRPAAFPDSPVVGPWIGGYLERSSGAPPVWKWTTGEPWGYVNWLPPNPDGPGVWNEDRTCLTSFGGRWNDFNESGQQPCCRVVGYLVEWSSDCNGDGIVDYGQILQGQLPDANANGVPDGCEAPTCRNADLFADRNVNGVDLGILLSQWGAAGPYTVSDLNRDGAVDGIDLGLFLSFWGPCPY